MPDDIQREVCWSLQEHWRCEHGIYDFNVAVEWNFVCMAQLTLVGFPIIVCIKLKSIISYTSNFKTIYFMNF